MSLLTNLQEIGVLIPKSPSTTQKWVLHAKSIFVRGRVFIMDLFCDAACDRGYWERVVQY